MCSDFGLSVCKIHSKTRSKGSVNLPQGSVNLVVICKFAKISGEKIVAKHIRKISLHDLPKK